MAPDIAAPEFAAKVEEIRGRLARLPRARLAHLPTPLDPCPNLGRALGGPDIFIKRDDCTGLAFGGNKSRQLEYILGDALARGFDCVIQGAASQSNHARQLAAAGAKLGLDVYLTPKLDARSSPIQGNFLACHLLGAQIHPVPADASNTQAKQELAERLRREGRRPYIVGMGATGTLALAAVAYVGTALEILEQLAAQGTPAPDFIYTASQGGTQAGLQLACMLLGLPTRVVGINPMQPGDEAYIPPKDIAELIHLAAGKLGYDVQVAEAGIENTAAYVGPGYGKPSEAGLEAIDLLARHEGILLDPVYTGKAFSGLIDHIRQGRLQQGQRVVFIHTGGLPALFAYAPDLVQVDYAKA